MGKKSNKQELDTWRNHTAQMELERWGKFVSKRLRQHREWETKYMTKSATEGLITKSDHFG